MKANDKRIVIFGGGGGFNEANVYDNTIPVKNRYVVLNTETLEWYHGDKKPQNEAPFRRHTATLYNDYMGLLQ